MLKKILVGILVTFVLTVIAAFIVTGIYYNNNVRIWPDGAKGLFIVLAWFAVSIGLTVAIIYKPKK